METVLRGVGASIGRVKGSVKVIKTMEDFSKFETGDIICTVMTDPSMTPIIMRAAGIITDIGGICSHASIVSREVGIPCVVATENASTILYDGDIVEIDGELGEVYLIKRGKNENSEK